MWYVYVPVAIIFWLMGGVVFYKGHKRYDDPNFKQHENKLFKSFHNNYPTIMMTLGLFLFLIGVVFIIIIFI